MPGRAAVVRSELNPALPDQPLNLRPGAVPQTPRQKLIQSRAGVRPACTLEVDVLGPWRLAAVAGGHDLWEPWRNPARRQAPGARRRASADGGPPERASSTSITMLSGTSSTETNCEVESASRTVPRGSPR